MSIQELQTSRLDINNNYEIDVTFKQLDDIVLKIVIYDKSLPADLSNYTARLKAFKSDQVPLIQNTQIYINNNEVTIEGDPQLGTTSGMVKAELQFINKTTFEKKSTFYININVVASVLETDRGISVATCTLLKEIDNKLDQIENIGNILEDAIEVNNELKDTTTPAAHAASLELQSTIDDANISKLALDASNENATNTKNTLDALNTDAINTKNALDISKNDAETIKESLETFVSEHQDVTDISNQLNNISSQMSKIPNQTYISEKAKIVDVNNALATKADKITTDNIQSQVSSLASGSPKGVYTTLGALTTAIPSGNGNIYVVTGDIKEVDTLTVTGIPTVAGNITITLNGVAFTVALTTAMTTTDLVATAIRGTTFTGWTTGGIGSVVTFTKTTSGTNTTPTFSGGSTGSTATIAVTTAGVASDYGWYYWNNVWTRGGTYQSAGIADGTVTVAKLASDAQLLLGNYERVLNKHNLIPLSTFEDLAKWNQPLAGTVALQEVGICNGYKSVKITSSITSTVLNYFAITALPNTTYTFSLEYKSDIAWAWTIFEYNTNAFITQTKVYPPASSSSKKKVKVSVTTNASTNTIKFAIATGAVGYVEVAKPMMYIGSAEQYYDLQEIIDNIKSDIVTVNGNLANIENEYNNNKLYGKKIALDGDSICYGAGYVGGFGKLIADRNSMSYQNVAVSGATMATGTKNGSVDRHWVSTNIANLDSNADYIVIEAGINDYFNSVPLGNVTSTYHDSASECDTTTFAGAMEYACIVLCTQFSSKKKLFVLPHRMNRVYVLQNTNGNTFVDYIEIAQKVCDKYGIKLLDLGSVCGLNTYWSNNKTLYTDSADGVHPNQLAYETFYVDPIENALNSL